MSILIVGANGNMGSRYRSVLSFLNKSYVGVDIGHSQAHIESEAIKCDGILIATPTDTHDTIIRTLSRFQKPILCEKPLSKDPYALKDTLEIVKSNKCPLAMVYQYCLFDRPGDGNTYYDYFKHGNDGLEWDCLQIIGLARGGLTLMERSPIWKCVLNGTEVNIRDMDQAYINFVSKWFNNPNLQHPSHLLDIHEKADRLFKERTTQCQA